MTVDSIPVSELGQRGAGLRLHTVRDVTKAYAAIASSPANISSFAFMFKLSLIIERSPSRHAL
jgi:hypothetical protein